MSELSDVKAEEQTAEEQVAGLVEDAKAQQAAVVAAPEPKPPRRLNLIGRRNWFFALSLIIIIPGIVSMATKHFALGIDFAGGTELTVSFSSHPTLGEVQSAVDREGTNGSVISTGGDGYIIRYPALNTT